MPLFNENPYLEGADVINACFGSTQALFNAIDYVRIYGKYAIVVAADLAIYDTGKKLNVWKV
jgi:hydroxymethylglutaryl-CoA synthase